MKEKTKVEVVITPKGVEETRLKTTKSQELKAMAFYLGIMDELAKLSRIARWAWFTAEEEYAEIFGDEAEEGGDEALESQGKD